MLNNANYPYAGTGYGIGYPQGASYGGYNQSNYIPAQYMFNSFYHGFIYDKICFDNAWFRPQKIVYNICDKKGFEAKELNKNNGSYCMVERNGRKVIVGKLVLKDKYFVNPHDDGTFDALYCKIECEGHDEPVEIAIPYRDLVKHNVLQYLPMFNRNEDCPPQYITAAFYKELASGDDIKFLMLPEHSGWQECDKENKTIFASAEIVIPQLKKYYAVDIINRELINTTKKLAEASEALAKVMPAFWKYKLLLAVRITAVLLFFYWQAEKLTFDQLFVIGAKSDSNARTAIAILKGKTSTNVCRIIDCKTQIQRELSNVYDGVAVFRESSYVEQKKKLDEGMDVLLNDLYNCTENGNRIRHISAIVSDHPGNISSETNAYFIGLEDCPDVNNNNELLQCIGEFEYALIRLLANSDITENLVTTELRKTACLTKTIRNSEYHMSMRMLRTTAELLYDYKLISSSEMKRIIDYFKTNNNETPDTEQAITNEVREVLSDCISRNGIKVSVDGGTSYFDSTKPMVYIDKNYVNIMASTIDSRLLMLMKTTQKRNKMLSALKSCGKLYANNNYKRNIDIEVAPAIFKTFSVYSFTKDLLTATCLSKIEAMTYDNYLFTKRESPDGFIPIIKIDWCDKMAGRVVNDTFDEADSMYVSGRTRSGKTRFLVEQAIIRKKSNETTFILDQTGAFSRDELKKHLPDEDVDKYFLHWDIGKYGIPVNLLSLENCSTLPDKKTRLFSLCSVAARIIGEVKGKLLKRILKPIIEAIEAGMVTNLLDILEFFDKNDPEQSDIRERLEEVFMEFEGLNTYEQNWGEFLGSQSKIVVLSTSADGVNKGNVVIDMLLTSLYEYKQHDRNPRYTIIVDEIEDLSLEKEGPISTILRKGGKHRLSLILASQSYSVDKDKLGKLIGNCGTHVLFHPKDYGIAKHISVDQSTLASLGQGECIVYGLVYNKDEKKHKHITIKGQTYKHNDK